MSLRADFRVCLDADVLANQAVCDLLLRLAEHPRLYSPVFSTVILDEVYRVHTERLKRPWPKGLADYWQSEVRRNFPEAMIEGFDALIPALALPDADDRHVLADSRGKPPQLVLAGLAKTLPRFAELVAEKLGWELE